MAEISDTRPIGVFDSGIGGMTVLRQLKSSFPNESFIYLGDTARLPYGVKSPQTIYRYTEQNLQFLLNKKVKALVIACNSASSVFKENRFSDIPVYNVIDPAAEYALTLSENNILGIVGTRATINSNAYPKALNEKNPQAQVYQVACPLWVPFAEEGLADDPLTNLIVFRYLQPLLQVGMDTLILGCTHYPILAQAIQKVVSSNIQLIDCGVAVAKTMEKDFASQNLIPNKDLAPSIECLVSDHSENTHEVCHQIFDETYDFQLVDIST